MKKLLTILILCSTIHAYSAVYYVSTSGIDISTRTGLKGQEWKTLFYACSRVTKSGDTIYVMPGTYVETKKSMLAVGVNLLGAGATSIIKSNISGNDVTIQVSYVTPVQSVKQSISFLYFDGNNYSALMALFIYRGFVEIHHCTFVNYLMQAIEFQSNYNGIYALNNSFHDNSVLNCANQDGTGNGNRSSISFCDQDGLTIYNNTIINDRSNGLNGNCIGSVPGHFKNVKIYNNTLHKIYNPINPWDFAIEMWFSEGGNEIYGNDIIGSIDLVDFIDKGSSAYTMWIHDNTIGQSTLTEYLPIYGFIIEQEIHDIIIERNTVKNVNIAITYSLIGLMNVSNLFFRYNLFYNIGAAGTPPWDMGFGTQAMHEGHEVSSKITNLYYDNNTFVGASNVTGRTAWGIELPASCQSSYIYIRNNIIYNFTNSPITIFNPNGGATLDYLYIQNNLMYGCGNSNSPLYKGITPTNITNQNNITSNPLFVTSSDFYLQPISKAINSGLNIGLKTDIENNPIIDIPDIGAYEFMSNKLVITGVTASNKTYDGTNLATLNGGKLTGVLNSDIVSFVPGIGKFADKNVGIGKQVTVSGYTLTGANAGNYTLVQPIVGKADITPKNVSFTATSNNKVYDGNDLIPLNIGPLTGIITPDILTLGNGSGKFPDKNVGIGKQVTASGYALIGADAGNYKLILPTINKADITPKSISFISTASSKVYDGNDIANINFGPISGAVSADNVILTNGTGKFSDKNVGTGKSVVISGYALSGTNAINYTMVQTLVAKADITPKNLTFTVTADNKVYDGNDSASLNIGPLSGVIPSDNVSLKNGIGTFADYNVGLAKEVTLTGFSITGPDAANYILSIPENPQADITIKAENGNNLISIPNVITPNGDGKNDVWQIGRIEQYPNNEIEVFNRNGLAVFKANGYNNNWTGDYLSNGKTLPEGNYYYIINLGVENTTYKGTLSIVRGNSKIE